MFRKQWVSDSDAVEGKVATLLLILALAGQIISTLIITPVVDYLKDANYFMLVPCVQSAITFFLACCLTPPKEDIAE